MIIGRDLLRELKIKLDFERDTILYEHLEIPMVDITTLTKDAHFATHIREPAVAAEAVQRVTEILDAKYAPVSPQQIIDNSPHLNDGMKQQLLAVLNKHKSLFDGTLGEWKGIQHKIELKDPNCSPVSLRPYK